jgi:hypothetical protein
MLKQLDPNGKTYIGDLDFYQQCAIIGHEKECGIVIMDVNMLVSNKCLIALRIDGKRIENGYIINDTFHSNLEIEKLTTKYPRSRKFINNTIVSLNETKHILEEQIKELQKELETAPDIQY